MRNLTPLSKDFHYYNDYPSDGKEYFTPSQQLRILSCAVIFEQTLIQKMGIVRYAWACHDGQTPAVRYTIKALKNRILRGYAKNYTDALDQLEVEQANDRQARFDKYLYQAALTNDGGLARLYEKAEAERAQSHWSHEADLTAVAQAIVEQRREQEAKQDHITDIENRTILNLYIGAYIRQLSNTKKKRLTEVLAYIGRESEGDSVKAEEVIAYITSNARREDPETSAMFNVVRNLHYSFEHKDAVTRSELLSILYHNIPEMSVS
jgi:hypothetical protein